MKIVEAKVQVGSYQWFYRETKPKGTEPVGIVILLHGLVSQGYGWREVLPVLAEQGYRAIAPDWLGCGYSDMPDRLDFAYTPELLIEALGGFLDALEISTCTIVAQGFLATAGIQYALRYPDRVDRLAIFNAPIFQNVKLPWKLKQLGIPLIGEALVQDFTLPDKILEGAGGYRVEDKDMEIYRRPWIKTSDAGRALHAMVQNLQLAKVSTELEQGLKTWRKPLLIGWGMRDPWLSVEAAKALSAVVPDGEFVELYEVGHYVQEDWPEKVNEALIRLLKRQAT
ncbi:MAG: hydrolase [Alkalinema sp. CACIAM 70d]|nr:MAG: hydrolase [Alkalinema sp. CACIAM 70d]